MFETAIAPPVKAKLETTKPLPSLGNMFMSSVKITIQSTSFFQLMFRQVKVDLKVQQTKGGQSFITKLTNLHYKPLKITANK